MSGPVTRPLEIKESDNSVRVKPATVLNLNAADFTISATGSEATVSLASGGSGASLTDTYIGFGDSSNLLTGSANFTFTEESGGTGPTVQITGDKPQITIQDDTDATDYKTKLIQSGASLYHYSADSTGTNNEMARYAQNYIAFQRSMTANVGIGTVPATGVALHIKDAESDNDNVVIRIQDDSANTVGDQIAIEGYYNTVEAGRMFFELRDTTNGASAYVIDVFDGSDLMEFVRMDGDSGAITFNEQSEDIDFRVETANIDSTLRIVGSQDNVGICTIPNSNTVLHISDDGGKANTVRIESTDNDTAVGPVLDIRRNNADGTATDGDRLGVIQFTGLDDTGSSETYSRIICDAADTHSTQADGNLRINGLVAGSEIEYARHGSGVTTYNEGGIDLDFRIECDSGATGVASPANAFFLQGSTGNIGMGTNSPENQLHIRQSSDSTLLMLEQNEDSSAAAPSIYMWKNRANPANGENLGIIYFAGEDSGGARARIQAFRSI